MSFSLSLELLGYILWKENKRSSNQHCSIVDVALNLNLASIQFRIASKNSVEWLKFPTYVKDVVFKLCFEASNQHSAYFPRHQHHLINQFTANHPKFSKVFSASQVSIISNRSNWSNLNLHPSTSSPRSPPRGPPRATRNDKVTPFECTTVYPVNKCRLENDNDVDQEKLLVNWKITPASNWSMIFRSHFSATFPPGRSAAAIIDHYWLRTTGG